MIPKCHPGLLLLPCMVVSLAQKIAADETPSDEQAIRAKIQSYVDAFNKHDAEAVAAHWTENGDFVTPGELDLKGRQAIQAEFEAYFQGSPEARVEVTEPEIRFLSPGVAVEEGTARLLAPEPTETQYVAIHVKTAEGWRMDSVREQAQARPQSHYEQLKELEWMIGEWVDADDDATVETTCQWTKNNNFITRSFRVYVAGSVNLEGTQIIGWDPAARTIRSWMFDSEGGFGVGVWTRNGDQWTVRALQVLAGGERASAINTMTYVDDDTFTIRSTNREIDGELSPDIPEIKVVRK